MEKTTDSIASRLIDKADENLKKEISEAAEKLREFIYGWNRCNVQLETQNGIMEISPFTMLDSFEKFAFEINHEKRREREIEEFMNKVDNLDSQIQELTNNFKTQQQ